MKPQIFFFHFAGGSVYSFEFMRNHLSEFEMICLELPGRGMRMNELLCSDFDTITNDLYKQLLLRLRPGKFFLYGHSLGALLALKITFLLEQIGKEPTALIVTGSTGPRENHYENEHLLETATFKSKLKQLGGIAEEVLDNDELFEYFQPILRSDFELYGTCTPSRFLPVHTPVIAAMGSDEDNADKLDNWRKYASGGLSTRIFPGNHFFILHSVKQLSKIIRDSMPQLEKL